MVQETPLFVLEMHGFGDLCPIVAQLIHKVPLLLAYPAPVGVAHLLGGHVDVDLRPQAGQAVQQVFVRHPRPAATRVARVQPEHGPEPAQEQSQPHYVLLSQGYDSTTLRVEIEIIINAGTVKCSAQFQLTWNTQQNDKNVL